MIDLKFKSEAELESFESFFRGVMLLTKRLVDSQKNDLRYFMDTTDTI